MANQEVIDAIRETVKPNGVKAITADSLANLLELMVEKTGEGTGSGAVRVHLVPEDDLDFNTIDFTDDALLTPAEAEFFVARIQLAQQENQEAYNLLIKRGEECVADLVLADASLFYTWTGIGTIRMLEVLYKEYLPDVEFDWSPFTFSCSVGMPLYCEAGKVDTSGLDENSLTIFNELIGGEDIMGEQVILSDLSYPDRSYELKEDGSVLYTEAASGVDAYEPIIYLSTENGLTEDLIAANMAATGVLKRWIGQFWSVRENYIITETGSSSWQEKGGCVHEIDSGTSATYFRYWKGADLMQVSIDRESGAATLEVYASLTPTA